MDPSVFVQGGNVIMYDARSTASVPNPPAMYVLDSMAPYDTSFAKVALPMSPDGSYGPHGRSFVRYFEWGSYLFAFGGSRINQCCTPPSPCSNPCPANQTFNDMWVMELSWNVLKSATAGPYVPWTQVSPAAVNGLVPGYPAPRIGSTITPFHTHAFLFGGVSRSDPAADPGECIYARDPTTAPKDCFFHSHVHGVQPSGMAGAVVVNGVIPDTSGLQLPGTQWAQWGEGGVDGKPMISGRADHTAGAMGNQFFVYGGVTAPGVRTNDLWAYNLVSQTWAQVTAPNGPPLGYAVAQVIGMSYFVLSQNADFPRPGQPSAPPAPAALWRWRPAFGAGGGAAAASNAGYSAAVASGHTAGIVIGILTGLANLYCLVALMGNAGVNLLPEWAERIPVVGPYLAAGGSPRKGPAGFYPTSSGAALNAAAAG